MALLTDIVPARPLPAGAAKVPLWDRQARHWSVVRPPLRPVAEDLAPMQAAIDTCRGPGRSESLTVALLGVTPEVATLSLPPGSRLLAVDLSQGMVRGVWPASTVGPRRWAVQGDWLRLPLADASCDAVVGDGCFVLLSGTQPDELIESVHRVLRPGGTLAIRVFIAPDRAERPADVWQQLRAGAIGNFHAFKFRLLASLRKSDGHVAVDAAWQFFRARCPDPALLGEQLNWPVQEVRTIESYCGQPAIYWFPTVGQFRQRFAGRLEEVACHQPSYELGERCLTFVLRKSF